MFFEEQIQCPYCGESFTSFLDLSQGNQRTIEDCYVCCRPIELKIESDGSRLLNLTALTDDETF